MSIANPPKTRINRAVQADARPKVDSKVNLDLLLPVRDLKPAPENDRVYHPINRKSVAFLDLVASVKNRGILEPLVVSADGFILSGHRRHAAARAAGLSEVPCRVLPVRRDSDPDAFLALLVDYNKQRVKDTAEATREAVVGLNPEEAYQALIEHRQSKLGDLRPAAGFDPGAGRGRKVISPAKAELVSAVKRVVEERRTWWPISDRAVHYGLVSLADPPRLHMGKRGRYANNLQSYRAVVDILTRARLVGEISMAAICDDTRTVKTWETSANVGYFIQAELDNLLRSFWRDLQRTQPVHLEMIVEKLTLLPILRDVAMRYTIPMTVARGFISLPPRAAIVQRFRQSGKDKLGLVIVSDLDPDGQEIAASLVRSLRDDFGIPEAAIVAHKAAITPDQVRRFKLPLALEAKKTSLNYRKFVALYGTGAHEVEALAPADLQAVVSECVDGLLDVAAFNAELDQEKADAAELEALRRRLRSAILEIRPDAENS